MDFLTPEWEDVDTQQPLILNTRTSGRISVMNTALDGSRTITEVSVLAALACDDPAEGKLQASNVLRKAPLPATAAEGRYFEHDGAYHFVLDLVERSRTHSIQVFRRIKDASYQLCRTIDPPSHFGVPACMSIRWPVGVVVTEVPPEGPETGWILFWNLETYKRFREVRLAHKTRAFEVDFDEEAGLIFVGTVYLSNNHDDVLHEQLHIDWRRVEGSAWNPSRVGRSNLEGYIKHISVIPDDEHFFKSSDNVHADIATDTLIVTYGWGLVLTRPYSKLKDRRFDCIKVAILHYCYVGERRSVGFTPIAPTLEVEQTAFGIGRLCQYATHRPPFSWMPLYHMIVIDLNAFRLDSMWTPKDHVFENVQAWLLETKGRPTSDSELSKDEERDPEAEDFFWHLWMDATTVYTIRTQSGLELVDFGLAVNPRPSPAAPDVSPKRQKQPARQARRR
ncbi:hypothetical protein CBOM_02636 [Ceraceosorus bombacis]|uniref:Uncharacterized protein n=1 Tax=Ceraceosorus bombacis TaxID=401625 RepID=A0A0P1BFI7_9BASI|nr:hypothetical protein CBOM_02636 [Ceraceosorus bombacis]